MINNGTNNLKARQGSTQSLASNTRRPMSRLELLKASTNKPTLSPDAQRYASEEEKNKGGVLGGIGYVGEKVGLGILQGVEGIFDYVGAGILDLFGADDAAEDVLENDWVNYSHADEWFNPGEGWKVAGDVGGGIGTSIPGLAAGVVAGVATGGASLVPTIAGLATSGLSAAGTSTKEAFQESGELGLKEFGYGAIMGGVEAGTEFLSGKIGAGILKNADDIAAAFGKTASKTAKAVSAKTIAASLGKEFASEAFEEGFAEFVSPYAKRLTYDPNAKNATIEEISYAALVGGLSGIVMGGGTTTITQTTNLARGSKAVDAGRVASIMDTAKAFSDYEGTSPTKLSSMEAIRDLYTRLESQGVRESTKLTVNQRRAIGELQSLTTTAVFEPAMRKSAISAIEGADVIAQKLNADGQIKIVDGKMQAVTAESLAELQKQGIEVRDITAEDIRGGVDVKNGKSVAKAMKENDLLRYIAASDVAGRFMMTAKEVETAARAGTKIRSQADLNNYIEKATPEMKAALGAELGIADNEWDTLKLQRFNEAAAAYRESGKLEAKRDEIKAKEKASKEAKRMSMDSVGENAEQTAEPAKTKVAEVKERIEAKKIDEYVRENIEGYASMGEANKSMIRQVVREGRALGISEADILSYARVAEHTGLNVEFDASIKDGEAGYYDPKSNKIVVNPKTTKKHELLLIHELDHALRKFVAGDKVHTIVYENADKRLSQETRDMIEKEYSDQDTDVSREELFADEASAYYSEAILGGKVTVDMLLGKETTLKQKILTFFTDAARAYSKDAKLAKEARAHYRRFKKLFDSFAERNKGRNAETAEEARGKVSDSRFSLEFAPKIAENQREFLAKDSRIRKIKKQEVTLTESELEKAIAQTAEMVDAMSDKKSILPKDKVGKTLVKNGSYDISVENTTICLRTLSYNSFVDMVSEKIGRPLSQMESFLVSQKLYDIAKEPQCLYCYVSLDRKAYNDMLLRYIEQRDAAIKAYVDAGKPKLTKDSTLYKDFLNGRKPTDNMWDRYSGWIKAYNDGVHILTAEDIATEAKRSNLFNSKDTSQSSQVKDMLKYAQSASWAKKQTDYVAYYDDILKLSDKVIKELNKHYGLRWYSFSDYSGAFIVENMQQITDAAIRGLKGLAYTKDTDFAKIFAPTGMNINISVYVTKDGKGGYVVDEKQSANIKEAIALREQYPNVGIVAVATDQQGVEWALNQEWSDVVIPFHTVRTGAQVAEFYDWTVFNEEQNDTIKDENLWDTYTESVTNGNEKAKKKVSKMVYPSEHQNNKETYLRIIEERGLKPRFSSFLDNPNYMKLVNETRQSESQTKPLKPDFALDAAKESFGKFVEKGGYYEGWYNDGIDVDGEAEIVAQDIREGKKANEVDYGRQDRNGNATPTPEELMASRKKSRSHGATVKSAEGVRYAKDFTASIDELNKGTFDVKSNTHIKVMDHTPQIFIDKAGAADRKIIMSWDVAFLAMKRREDAIGMYRGISNEYDEALNKGNYHGLGTDILNEIPNALESPLYIVRQENGRICIVTEIMYKNKRPIFAVVELEDFKTITTEGVDEEDTYNLIVTISNGQPRYFKNNVFQGEILYNKNNEDPAHFISRLQSLNKLTPKNDLAGSSDISIPQSAEKSTPSAKKVSENSSNLDESARKSMDITPEIEAEFKSPTEENVGKSRFEEPDVKLKDKITEKFATTKDKVYIDTVDETYGIEKYLKTRGKMKNADAFIQQVRAAETIAQTMIGVSQYDITNNQGKRLGDGVRKIFKKYNVRKIKGKFNDYLLHQLNVDRMTLEERSLQKKEELRKEFEVAEAAMDRAKRDVDEGRRKTIPRAVTTAYNKAKFAYESYEVMKNKPVFGENEKRAKAITAEESRKIIAEYEKHYPEFKESAEEVWAYSRNLLKMRVKAGLLSAEDADFMETLYPHYVPSFRDTSGGVGSGTVKNESQLAVNDTIKSATGGGSDVYDIEESLAIQTKQAIKAIKMNQLANAVLDSATFSGDTKYVLTEEAAEQRRHSDPDEDTDIDLKPKNNQIVFYRDGKKMTMNVAEEIFVGFKGLTDGSVPNSVLGRLSSKALGAFKNLVTQYSPAFAARNFVRDMQDAIINTKHPKQFATHIKAALEGMANNDADWQTYLAYGGYASTVFDAKGLQNDVDARGFAELKKISGIDAKDFKSMAIPLQNLFKFIGNANSVVEQLTRFTEYKASIAAGDSIEVAINNSAEVTTNFARHGKTVKMLNATVIPFLNASVQGFDKMLRVISGPYKEKSMTALAILLAKIVAIGITPQIINMIMNGDDEDYENLTDDVKSNYFLVKVGDQFLKIPRGRLAGAFGGLANQLRNVSRGEGFNAEEYAESIVSNLTPVDSFSRTIFSPVADVMTNTTWYGGEIEGRQFEGVRPGQRYDESTSSIAIAIGGAINYSPKKIHYLLDQYTGVIGDFLLPATTKKAEKDYLSGNFLLDPKTNNKLSNEFYKLYDEAQYAKNEGNVTAYYQLKHLNEVKSSVSELYDEITEIQNSDLSNSEKLQQVRTIRVLINNLYKTAADDYAAYTKAIEATEGMFDESDATQQRLRHTVITQMMYGSEKALEEYNSAVYEKASVFNKAGIDWDTYYEYYFSTRGIEADVDRKGEKVAGSKKTKVVNAIKALGVSQTERLLLTAAAGYSLTESEKKRLISYINKLAVTKDEKIAIAEACGFTVKNGRISLK